MKKIIFIMFSTVLILLAQSSFIFAAETKNSFYDPSTNTNKVLIKGDGYTVTDSNKSIISPLSTTTHTMNLGGSGNYAGQTAIPYSNGNLYNYSRISLSNTHNIIGNDYLYAYGYQNAGYSGTNPTYPTSLTIQPSQTMRATDTVIGISLPGGVSFSPLGQQATLTWLSSVLPGQRSADYYWDQWGTATGGRFTQCSANDQLLWQFGTTNISELNTVVVNIQ
jgi:hypothetical protein